MCECYQHLAAVIINIHKSIDFLHVQDSNESYIKKSLVLINYRTAL